MSRAANSGPTIRFGIFEVDPHSLELWKNGRKVHVQALPVRLLLVLLKRPGELVTPEELREELWPADTFVDFERSLHVAAANGGTRFAGQGVSRGGPLIQSRFR